MVLIDTSMIVASAIALALSALLILAAAGLLLSDRRRLRSTARAHEPAPALAELRTHQRPSSNDQPAADNQERRTAA